MRIFRKKLPLLLGFVASITVAFAVDKGGKFTPPPIDSLTTKLTSEGVTIAAVPYTSDAQAKTAFGKLNPYDYGILPVLVMVRNDSKGAVRLGTTKFEYLNNSGDRVEAVPASEVKYTRSPRRPNFGPGPIPGVRLKSKNPLDAVEIETRAFAPKMLPPGDSAYGFVYFRSGHRPGSKLYVTGIQDAASNRDLFYFEVPLD